MDNSIEKKIHEAIGEASMCWKPRPTGVFDSRRAAEIADKLVDAVKELVKSERIKLLRGLNKT
jgi:hypothetical protein